MSLLEVIASALVVAMVLLAFMLGHSSDLRTYNAVRSQSAVAEVEADLRVFVLRTMKTWMEGIIQTSPVCHTQHVSGGGVHDDFNAMWTGNSTTPGGLQLTLLTSTSQTTTQTGVNGKSYNDAVSRCATSSTINPPNGNTNIRNDDIIYFCMLVTPGTGLTLMPRSFGSLASPNLGAQVPAVAEFRYEEWNPLSTSTIQCKDLSAALSASPPPMGKLTYTFYWRSDWNGTGSNAVDQRIHQKTGYFISGN